MRPLTAVLIVVAFLAAIGGLMSGRSLWGSVAWASHRQPAQVPHYPPLGRGPIQT
jgi:hypothetical protein